MILSQILIPAAVVIGAACLLVATRRGSTPARDRSPQPAMPGTASRTSGGSAVQPGPANQAEAVRAQIRLHFYQLAFGDHTSLTAAPGQEAVVATTHDALASIAAQPNYAPRRPLLLPRLVQAVNDNDVSRRELAGIIASDPGLTANLLRLANSSFYRVGNEPVESIDRAVAVLGTEGIRSLIATALMQPVFRVGAGEFAQFPEVIWEYTCRSASAAESHAAIVENSDPFAGQLLGLLLGLADIVIFRVALDQYAAHQLRVDAGTLMTLIETLEAPVASQIAASWELSERIGQALADQGQRRGTGTLSPLGRSLSFGTDAGALALLQLFNRVSPEEAPQLLAAAGHDSQSAARIWERLTAPRP